MMSEQLETLIKTFEGLSLKVYVDAVGVNTAGYGHVCDLPIGQPISIQQAEEWLLADIQKAQYLIPQYITVPLNQNQLDALTSLVFNEGVPPLEGTLGHLLNISDYISAALQFSRWIYAGKPPRVLPGLVRRRAAEQKLFNTTPTGE